MVTSHFKLGNCRQKTIRRIFVRARDVRQSELLAAFSFKLGDEAVFRRASVRLAGCEEALEVVGHLLGRVDVPKDTLLAGI